MPAITIAADLNHLEAQHWTDAKFDATVILFDQVVQAI